MTDEKMLPAHSGEPEPAQPTASLGQIVVFFAALIILLLLLLTSQPATSVTPAVTPEATAETAAVEQGISFIQPEDGAAVPPTFTVEIGVEGLTIEPSGEVHENAGHLHILVNADFVEPGTVIPADESHIHMGDGSTSRELTLEPGEYTLRLQFADGVHTALEGDQYRAEISVTVADDAE